MGKKKGRMIYVPPSLLDLIDEVKLDEEVFKSSEAIRKIVNNARIGREFKKRGLL